MRQALNKSTRGNRGLTVSYPSTIGGLNTVDGLADMDIKDALVMDNVWPRTADVTLRKGYTDHVTGITGNVETVMQYASGSARKMFAAATTAIYDVTSSGVVGAAVLSGQSNARWQYTNFGTSGGQFLVLANGQDTVVNYNGSTWQTTPAITGVTSSTLIHINQFKQRLYFVEKNSLSAWYLPVSSIGGAAAELDFSSLFGLGGYLMAMGTWTIDGGSGMDDYAVWITSEGEVAVYAGTDPSSSTTWGLVGIYRIGKPIGRRCMVKMNGDLLIITNDGIVPLSKALKGRGTEEYSVSRKIRSVLSQDAITYGANFGWQAIQFPAVNMMVVNIPIIENNSIRQYAMNTITGAWCRFLDIDSYCYELFNEHLYFGTTGKVCKFWDGNSDLGFDINGNVKQAWSYFGRRNQLKKWNLVRPILLTDGVITPVIAINTDYEDVDPTSTPTFVELPGSPWDTSPWDTSSWTPTIGIQKNWQSVVGIGYAGSFRMKISSNAPEVSWPSTDFIFEGAGYL